MSDYNFEVFGYDPKANHTEITGVTWDSVDEKDPAVLADEQARAEVCKLLVHYNVSKPADIPFVLDNVNQTNDNVTYYFGDKTLPRPKQGW